MQGMIKRRPYGQVSLGERALQVRNGVVAVVKNRGGQGGIGTAFGQDSDEIARFACTARSNDGNGSGVGDGGS